MAPKKGTAAGKAKGKGKGRATAAGNQVQSGGVTKAATKRKTAAKPRKAAAKSTASGVSQPAPKTRDERARERENRAEERRAREAIERAEANGSPGGPADAGEHEIEDRTEEQQPPVPDPEAVVAPPAPETVVPPPTNTPPANRPNVAEPAGADHPDTALTPAAQPNVAGDDFINVPGLGDDVEVTVNVTFWQRPADLRVVLRVFQDKAFSARLGYAVKVYLRQDFNDTVDKDGNTAPVANGEQIGYIHAWRVDKPSSRNAQAARDAWVQQFLHGSLPGEGSDNREIALCLRSLYTNTGLLRKGLNAQHNEHLVLNSLMFIQMISIRLEYSRQGLLGHVFNAFYQLLTQLPEWHYFTGTAVLIPGAPEGPSGSVYKILRPGKQGREDMTLEEIEILLTNTYQKYGYEIWVRQHQFGPIADRFGVRAMGRTVPPPPVIAGPSSS